MAPKRKQAQGVSKEQVPAGVIQAVYREIVTPLDAGATLFGGAVGYLGEGYADIVPGLDPGGVGIGVAILGLSIVKLVAARSEARRTRAKRAQKQEMRRRKASQKPKASMNSPIINSPIAAVSTRQSNRRRQMLAAERRRIEREEQVRMSAEMSRETPALTTLRAQALIDSLAASPNMQRDLRQTLTDYEAGKATIRALRDAIVRFGPSSGSPTS